MGITILIEQQFYYISQKKIEAICFKLIFLRLTLNAHKLEMLRADDFNNKARYFALVPRNGRYF